MFVLVGELSNLIKVRDTIPVLVCPARWPCALINSQDVRCTVLLCLSSSPSHPYSIFCTPGAQSLESAWINSPALVKMRPVLGNGADVGPDSEGACTLMQVRYYSDLTVKEVPS